MEADEEQKQLLPRSVPPAPRLDPWLVFLHGRRGQNQTFYSLSENRYHVRNIPNMRRKCFCTSSHGWIVIVDIYSDDCFLLNPVSMDKRQLPSAKSLTYDLCVLSSSPDDPNCIVLFIRNIKKGRVSVTYCHPGDSDWVMQDLKLEEDHTTIERVVCCGGKIYGLTCYYRRLVIFDVGITLTIREVGGENLPESSSPEMCRYLVNMVESCGELFVFRRILLGRFEVSDIEVFKMDFSRKVWVTVESLGDRAFFLSEYCSTSCSVKESGIKGDTIYFIERKDRSLYAFNFEDKNITVTLPCPNVKNHWFEPAEWVLPLV
ncbi:hypothetical protein L1049_020327 [Liquidambar formosana]|uniref:KIB1-4 beta-propeller domain-containing protein n=1 Tax=Liquidambar formosana TaxID=63359 RepID=A0AAP0X5X7_LIQFO